MRGMNEMLDPRLVQQQQQVDLARSMGVNFNPLEQLQGLVQLLNSTQAPQIQQGQFQQEFGLKEMLGTGELDNRNRALDQQKAHQNWQIQQGDRTLGLQERGFDQGERKIKQDATHHTAIMKQHKMSQAMNFFANLIQSVQQQQDSNVMNIDNVNAFGSRLGRQYQNLLTPQPQAPQAGGRVLDWSPGVRKQNEAASKK